MSKKFMVHAARKGKIRKRHNLDARAAARHAARLARVGGHSTTVFDDSRGVMMICTPSVRPSAVSGRVARCRFIDPSFKSRVKGR